MATQHVIRWGLMLSVMMGVADMGKVYWCEAWSAPSVWLVAVECGLSLVHIALCSMLAWTGGNARTGQRACEVLYAGGYAGN